MGLRRKQNEPVQQALAADRGQAMAIVLLIPRRIHGKVHTINVSHTLSDSVMMSHFLFIFTNPSFLVWTKRREIKDLLFLT
jgi:hypothetical protein